MYRMRYALSLLLIPAFLAAAVSLPGCDGNKKKVAPRGGGDDDEGNGEVVEKKPLETTGWADNWTGTITYDGTPPAPLPLDINKEQDICHSPAAVKGGDTVAHTWMVNASNKGVKNAVVFLELLDRNTFFKIKDEDKTLKEAPYLDQPYCAYRPHVTGYFASFYENGKERKRTGKELQLYNTSATKHNIKFIDVSAAAPEQPGSINLDPDPKKLNPREVKLYPQKSPIGVKCDIHPWMQGYVWVFDHPYFAITDDDGKFTMPRVPTGKEVRVVVWHEGAGAFVNAGEFRGKDGKTMTFGDTNAPLTLQIK